MEKQTYIPDFIADRIYSKIAVRDVDSCWEWTGIVNDSGRPKYSYEWRDPDGSRKTRAFSPQDVVYRRSFPDNPVARYYDLRCNNPRCCNPQHIVPRTLENRLWGNTTRPNGDDGCWFWGGFIQNNGYGTLTVNKVHVLVHRLSYEEFYQQKIPSGMMILHSCNNRSCINPNHLRMGTHADNMQDMVDADRAAKGEQNGHALLTEDQVKQIKHLSRQGVAIHILTKMFSCSRSTIKDIRSGRCWNWVD